MEKFIEKASVLIEALPYIQKFRGAIVVVKLGGSAMDQEKYVENTLRDIVFMEIVGMKPVLIHGGGKKISAKLREIGMKTRFIHGLRYTCKKTMDVVDEVLHHDVNPHLVSGIVKYGGKACGLSGKKILRARKLLLPSETTKPLVDMGYIAEVDSVETGAIQKILEQDIVPVITPVGCGDDGTLYNINADIVACKIAEKLQARKLVFLSDVPGILQDPQNEKSLISTVKINQVDGLIQSGIVSGGMIPKIQSAMKALQQGTKKIHLIDARIQHSLLLEIFTDKGIGTQIVGN